MSCSNSALYLPYGAYELKAKYQRNLLLSNLLLGLTVGLIVIACFVFSQEGSDIGGRPVIVSTLDSTLVSAHPVPPPSVVYGQERRPTPAPNERRGSIPVAVSDDSDWLDTVTIATQEELADIVGGFDTDEGDKGGIYIAPEDTDYIPSQTEFVSADKIPEFVHQEQPEYPRLIKNAGIPGKVILQALIDKEGNVKDVKVVKSSGTKGLDDSAVAAAYKNKFTPAISHGQPIYMWVIYTVEFVIE